MYFFTNTLVINQQSKSVSTPVTTSTSSFCWDDIFMMLDSFPCKILTKSSGRILVHFWLARLPRSHWPNMDHDSWQPKTRQESGQENGEILRKLPRSHQDSQQAFCCWDSHWDIKISQAKNLTKKLEYFFFWQSCQDLKTSTCRPRCHKFALYRIVRVHSTHTVYWQIQNYFFPRLSLFTFSSEPPVTFCFLKKPIRLQALCIHQSILRLCNVTSG